MQTLKTLIITDEQIGLSLHVPRLTFRKQVFSRQGPSVISAFFPWTGSNTFSLDAYL